MKEVQAFITNISFPKTMDEFLFFLEDNFHFNVDDVLNEDFLEWTAPRWSKINDIVFFMHSKTAISTITRLRTEYMNNKSNYTKQQQVLIEKGIEHAIENYKKYGGKIYAIGRIVKPTVYDDFYRDKIDLHWRGRIYAPISDVIKLENPIDISEFNDFIFISRQSAITGVFGKEYEKLKKIILTKNKTEAYFIDSISSVLPIKEINKNNWISISMKHRREFFLESQFRSYYTDYLLEKLTDKKVYKECTCRTKNKPDFFVDNVITINNHAILVEIKLNIDNEKDLSGQLDKYCNCDSIIIGNNSIPICECINKYAIIIDTDGIYLFNNQTKNIKMIYSLNNLKTIDEIDNIKELLITLMNL